MKDPYQILNVAKSASQDEIKDAYRKLAKKFHPDLNPGNKNSETKFKDIALAYELIGTPEMRAKFDRGETAEQEQNAAREHYERARQGQQSYYSTQQNGGRYASGFGADFGGDDFFENLFRGAGAARGTGSFAGHDELYQMEVSFQDAALGAEQEISLPQGKKLRVKIPAALESGAKLRFRGQGEPGIGGGPAGDVYVQVSVRPMAGFVRKGRDIESELPISIMEAVLGAELEAPTIDGTVRLKIPAGVSSGSRLRIRGKGAGSGKERGDQIVVLKILLPKKVDPALQEAIRAWQGKYSYNPRSAS